MAAKSACDREREVPQIVGVEKSYCGFNRLLQSLNSVGNVMALPKE